MPMAHRTRWTVLTITILAIGLAVWLGPELLASIVRKRTVQAMEQAAGPDSRITVDQVELELLSGNITWSGLRIQQVKDSLDTAWVRQRPVLIEGRVDRIAVTGLSLWRLLLGNSIRMQSLAVQGAALELISSGHQPPDGGPDSPRQQQKEKKEKAPVQELWLDNLLVERSSIAWRNVGNGEPSAHVGQLTMRASGVHAILPHRQTPFSLKFASATAMLDSTTASLPPLYDLRVDRVRLAHPDSVFQLVGIALTSRKGPDEYGQVIPYETDLITFTTDSIGMRGLDISALLNERSLRIGEARISGTSIHDFRDKTLQDAPFKIKPMPARLLRQLPFTVRVDSLLVEGMDVVYQEKDVVTSSFGKVAFSNIHAVAHGINTVHPEDKPVMHLVATASVYEKAPVHFDFRTTIFDSSDHFSVQARIGPLPFKVFNAMTNDLLLVRAMAGTISGIGYTFEANKDRGHGRVDVEYQDLKLRIAKRDGTREKNVLKSFLANQLIRSKNLRDGNFRHGDFTVQRVKDKQVFNYLWRGLRAGMMETVLPQILQDARSVVKTVKETTDKKPGK